ncbi:ECF RNA polymerase sigma factor SigK [Protaetiibacter mangrovi]|uniref:ECF RNA polymerase sigma factor SigK n=1 Tax=Protaetiibacter mangrovi TaxID=2970926 RepID=A0ABT1ZG77_9MICO|nr:ECF RNA polymerase sigma factor SigK [Protaetiibacter mangrovi]MCS0499709.1 ECF RNA polymerase sigma factor SigK [Protaetiibacter mangrovi]TPX02110.1 sigma-70 family RNA polymerase sigma factor [Schumannella luteola]
MLNAMDAQGVGRGLPNPDQLLARTADGDRAAFAELYDLMAPRILGLVKRLLRDPAQSEEVAQEVLLEIWQNAPSFRADRGGAVSWCLTIAHRRAVDRVRASQASHDRDLRIGARDLEPDYDDVAETVEIRIEHERVLRSMARLTELQREAVILAYYGGYTHNEMARMLGVPLGTVKTRLRDGMIRLRDDLGVDR